jgi:hypothetical protein
VNTRPFHSKILHRSGALGVELSAELLRAGRTGVPLVCCEVCTHNSQPFSSYDFGRPSPDGLEHAPRRPSARVSGCTCEVSMCVACHHRLVICSGISVGIMWVSSSPLDCLWAVAQLEHSIPAALTAAAWCGCGEPVTMAAVDTASTLNCAPIRTSLHGISMGGAHMMPRGATPSTVEC